MHIERRSGTDERRILTAMLVDPVVLARVAARWPREGLFGGQYANLIAGWAVHYHTRYGRAPGRSIEGMYEHWAERGDREKKTVELVGNFLSGLSDEYESAKHDTNPEYVLDLADRHFNTVRVRRLKDAIEGDLDTGDLASAERRIAEANRIELGGGAATDLMSDAEAVRAAFETSREPLITYPSALGEFFGTFLQRDGFIALEGPEKRGKTYWLLDLAWRAMCLRRRVAFFEVGDLSKAQIILRWCARAAKRPLAPGTYKIPTAIEYTGEGTQAAVTVRERTWTDPLDWREAWEACKAVTRHKIRSRESYFRLSVHPAGSINVAGVRGIVAGWVRAGWVPDVIVVDYADILAPPVGIQDGRDQINVTWMQLRALSQEMHNLVITASQTDAASYDVHTIGRRHFSNDKRKMAHVTGMVGLNATHAEKQDGITRCNWVVLREGRYSEGHCVHVVGNLALANPAMKSTW